MFDLSIIPLLLHQLVKDKSIQLLVPIIVNIE